MFHIYFPYRGMLEEFANTRPTVEEAIHDILDNYFEDENLVPMWVTSGISTDQPLAVVTPLKILGPKHALVAVVFSGEVEKYEVKYVISPTEGYLRTDITKVSL